ncbi:hypothetical protein O181_028751 [Austropuccinia psidii MF-1]|uniref:Uncharacterized protein n=1 Tax=Austropuccinia psidii MF-1 TaxID=1389203 RepID=A0A9Q3CV61_9BASI|nr:hypothetical protein [Austropuccinia psidii MF-1]
MPSTRSGDRHTPNATPKKVIDIIMAEANQFEKDKANQRAYNNALQNKEYEILAALCENWMNSYLTVIKFLGHPNNFKLLNGWHPLMEKKNMMRLTAEWRKSNPPSPKQLPKIAPVASRNNSNLKKQPQAHNKGKSKEPATKPYRHSYRNPNV